MPLSKKFLKKNHGKNFMININKAPAEIFKGSPEETPVKVLGKKSSIHPKKTERHPGSNIGRNLRKEIPEETSREIARAASASRETPRAPFRHIPGDSSRKFVEKVTEGTSREIPR